MGGGSTSHSAVLSDKKAGTSPAFDLHSWQGLTQVLKLGKESLKDPHAYAEFRNLVLEYAQQGGDAEIRKKIDATIATFGSAKMPAAEREMPGVSVPVRATTVSDVAPERASEKTEVEVKIKETPKIVSPSTRRIEPKFVSPVVEPAPLLVPKEEGPAPETITETAVPVQAPVPHETVSPAAPAPVPEVVPAPVPQATPAPVAQPASSPVGGAFKTLDEHKARIAEIKRIVHARVGNPAMLIDTYNENGKKYMQALLSALKATGGGGAEGVDAAMANLESAYETLMKSESVSQPEPEEVAEEEELKVPEVRIHAEMKEDPLPPAAEKEEEVALTEEEEVPAPAPLPSRTPQEKVIRQVDEKILTVMQGMQKEKTNENAYAPFYAEPKESSASSSKSFTGANRHVLRGVGKRPLEEVKKETGVDPLQVSIKQTELSSLEITETLHQLLAEWNIFHGSGLFGMGPSGAEHPLYKTLAPLSMGEVIAGRWEGSNHKLTKIIKQYVDAWRHEQGIAYVITETFEHYLRRVVQRILKRQNPS
jgi:hypothetical protein